MTVTVLALALIAVSSLLLFAYGVNLLYLSWRSLSLPSPALAALASGQEPLVAVQVPVYNERYVAERVINAVCALDWPRDRLEVQVLDDSDDETVAIVRRAVASWRRRGVRVTQVRRPGRDGYKAGALAHGLSLTAAPVCAILDADSLPPADFLRRTVCALADPKVGFVQARWEHLNERYSWFTRLQARMIDFHFLVEQPVRAQRGYLTNFAGSAGVWRRTAIDDAGGWSGRTLTEDLDLSYRAQLRGWRAVYREDVAVPQELPVAVNAYRTQQSRWAQGSFQCAFRLLPPLLASRLPAGTRFQGLVHLLGYAAPVLMLLQVAAYPAVLLAAGRPGGLGPLAHLPLGLSLISLAPAASFAVAQRRRGRVWWRQLPSILSWTVVGSGTSLTVGLSLLRAMAGGGEFRRTPKYHIEGAGQEWAAKAYTTAVEPVVLAELVLGLAAGGLAVAAAARGELVLAFYALLFAAGFLCLSLGSLAQAVEIVSFRHLGRNLPARIYRSLPSPALLAPLALLMVAVAQLPDPFEDSYQHWLIAATLAQTGQLRDPLFAMQDTWLPAYHLLGAAVLRATGLWNLWLLKLVNVALGVLTLVLTHHLAGTPRRARFAVALLALNPVFLLTTTTAVAEPLLVACLLGSVAAAQARRLELAAALAALACLTGTKAWLWLLGLAAVLLAEWARPPGLPAARRRLVWTIPVLALMVLLQSTFGFASHSIARGAQEVASAAARGSVASTGTARAGQFLWFFAISSLPLLGLSLAGAGLQLRDRGERFLVRTLHLPSLLYLAAVTGLVGFGIYSGSHRYYYPALPALALLAAGALDRLARPIGVLALAAAGVATVSFVPVFAGLAADNRGLVSAGHAAAGLPGGLLTDSPVAAYWSHKQPAAIHGSRELPADPLRALAWMRERQVGGIVAENIDYYRLTAVFPGLARGQASGDFVFLGDQSRYAVPGGKQTFVYGLAPLHSQAQLGGGIALAASPSVLPGKSRPIAKGPVLVAGGRELGGEGVGFAVPAVHDADGWHYPGSSQTLDLTAGNQVAWRRTYELDLASGDAARWYPLRPATSRGSIAVTYRIDRGSITVDVSPVRLAPGWDQLVLLNEESSRFDSLVEGGGTRTGSEFGGWLSLTGERAALRSSALGVEWELPAPPASAGFRAGRELQPPDLDWSGLEYQFSPGFTGVRYQINVRRRG